MSKQASAQTPERRLRVAFIHPDLGIGGAERLVVDSAVGLQERGHDVEILTSHHDPKHCFESTRDGTLVVRHMKTRIPRAILNSFHLPLAIAQQFSLFFQLCIALLCFRFPGALPKGLYDILSSTKPVQPYDLIFVDQLSAIVPWIRHVTATRVVFYCHYPDKEISNSIAKQRAVERGEGGTGLLRAIYRIPFDLYEEATMGSSDKVLVNSIFTQNQFIKSFPRLRREPRVLYPGIDLSQYSAAKAKTVAEDLGALGSSFSVKNAIKSICTGSSEHVNLVSINRFEAKKNISLAIDAFAQVREEEKKKEKPRALRLIVAGGHDRRLRDNVATLAELQAQATKLKLNHATLFWTPQPFEPPTSAPPAKQLNALHVVFLPSLPGALLPSLLLSPSTRVLLYTPPDEHFGIVPLEAMACSVPVLAANSGGPVESIVDAGATDGSGSFSNAEGTGLLRAPRPQIWAPAIMSLLDMSDSQRAKMARAAVDRVKNLFSLQVMTDGLEKALFDTDAQGPLNNAEGLMLWGSTLTIFAFTMALYIFKVYQAHYAPEPAGAVATASVSALAAGSSLTAAVKTVTSALSSAASAASSVAGSAADDVGSVAAKASAAVVDGAF